MNKNIPDISTCFTTKDGSRFRIEHWMKTIPLRYEPYTGEDAELLNEFFLETFLENHPDWHYEYVLVHCIQEEATHVTGRGECGATVALNDETVRFDFTYVAWNKEIIDEVRQRHLNTMTFYNNHHRRVIKGEWHE